MYYIAWFIIIIMMCFCGFRYDSPALWIVQAILFIGSFIRKKD